MKRQTCLLLVIIMGCVFGFILIWPSIYAPKNPVVYIPKHGYVSRLARAVAFDNDADIDRILKRSPEQISIDLGNGFGPLHFAFRNNRLDIVEKLLIRGANPNIHPQGHRGYLVSVLQVPMSEQRSRIFDMLLEANADPTWQEYAALRLACQPEFAEYFEQMFITLNKQEQQEAALVLHFYFKDGLPQHVIRIFADVGLH